MVVFKLVGAAPKGDSPPVPASGIGELGCGVIGMVAAEECTTTAHGSTEEAFSRWIAAGHRLEDWASPGTPDFDPAA